MGGWALKFQASLVNKYNSYLFFVDGPRAEGERNSDRFRVQTADSRWTLLKEYSLTADSRLVRIHNRKK
jgi:hypothetical protein